MKWEYTVQIDLPKSGLDLLGSNDWELVAVAIGTSLDRPIFYFKKLVQE